MVRVDGGVADAWLVAADRFEQLFDADVAVELEELLDDGIALTRRLQPVFRQSTVEPVDDFGDVVRA
jgi:hypothetical protein